MESLLIEIHKSKRILLQPFFSDMKESFIRTCLEGHMGRAWTDSELEPSFGLLQVGDFCFINGTISRQMMHVLTNLTYITELDSVLLVPGDERIGLLIERSCPNWKIRQRYAFEHKGEEFNLPYLKNIIGTLPSEYKLSSIDEYWYNKALLEEWSKDLVSNYESSEDFVNRGIGMVVTYNEEIISGASSYSIYDGGIEIQVDTKTPYRKQGLAHIVSAALIVACRERNIYPNWDAANEVSKQLAMKLGYCYSHSYNTYIITK